MYPSKRPLKTYTNKLLRKVGGQRDEQHNNNAEVEPTIKYEIFVEDSEDEQEQGILATNNESHYTGLTMTCSDIEDSYEASLDGCSESQSSYSKDREQSTEMTDVTRAKNAIPSKEPSIAKVLDILTTVSEHIKDMQGKTEAIQKEVASISNRLALVEKKVGISLATMEQVKDVIITSDATLGNDASISTEPRFELKPITNETELMEFDSKLGDDGEYYSNVKKWLIMQITLLNVEDPDNRMHIAMDLVFDRTFMPLCSWAGRSKIPLRERRNILKLFADIGSNEYYTVNELFVQKFFLKKLPYAKHRINMKNSKSSCRKRKSTYS